MESRLFFVLVLALLYPDPAWPRDKSFSGLWETSYGRLRLVGDRDKIEGVYSYGPDAKIQGHVEDKKAIFQYDEGDAKGEGWFVLAKDGNSFQGKWRENGSKIWQAWEGKRVAPAKGVSWLVIIEARWEETLSEPEFSFGDMLKPFFARDRNVQIRHRYFTDEKSLKLWLRETAFLAEPVLLSIATHGTPDGIAAGGENVGAVSLADSLKYSSSVQLLHFSACLMMKDKLASTLISSLGKSANFPISGYTTSVDWAGSALAEFMYFDLVLSRKMRPRAAAKLLPVVMPFAGDARIDGAPFDSLGFKFAN